MEEEEKLNIFGDFLKDNNMDLATSMSFFLEDPITLEYMEDAVMAPCGHSFSSEAINGWAGRNEGRVTCPTCQKVFDEEELKPNFKLREVVQYYKTQKEGGGSKKEDPKLIEERQRFEEEKLKMTEENRRLAEQQRKLEEERRRKEAELVGRLKKELEEKRELAEENVRLAELERRYVHQLEDLNRRQEALRAETRLKEEEEERLRKEKELREKGEVDLIMAKAVAEKRRYEELERKYKDLQTRYQLQSRQMDDLKGRYRAMENELSEVKGKYRGAVAEIRKKEEEEKKNSGSSLLSYIPFSAPSVPSFTWVWGATSSQPGPLVRKFSGYRLDSRRGTHRNSPVWKATKLEGAEPVALKKLTLRGDDQMVFREAMLHHRLTHPNILSLQGIMQGSNREEYFMALPFVEYDLDHVMNATRFNGAQVRHFMYQLILVVCYLHSAGVVHRDIQPSSVLVSNSGNGRIWLGSLGSARSLASRPFDPVSSSAYLCYRAPEIILSAGPLQKQLTDNDWRAADIWSCGCIFAQLMIRTPLFVGKGADQVLRSMLSFVDCRESIGEMGVNRFTSLNTHPAISDEPRTSFIETIKGRFKGGNETPTKGKGKEKEKERGPQEIERDLQEEELLETAHNLLQQMLAFDPDRRISALEALNHPYFEGYRALMQQKRTLWKCPVERAVLFEDSQVASFLEQQCATLTN